MSAVFFRPRRSGVPLVLVSAQATGSPTAALVTTQGPQRLRPTSSTLSTGAFTVCGQSSAYGRHVSGALENRAAVFTSQPQAVEVYQAGAWWAGELLGWRHDANGSCQVWVRVVLGGVEETAWTDLTTLRLPERHLSVAAQSVGHFGPPTQEMSVARHPSGRRARSVAADQATTSLPLVRELTAVPDLPVAGGRRTADETAQFASVGRRRAPEAADSPKGGRRRAPETGEVPAVVRQAAAGSIAAAPAPSAAAGRHRASGDPGRHRTADTGLLPAVARPAGPAPETRSTLVTRGSRPAPPVHTPRADAAVDGRAGEPELLTRPMLLTDHVPHARRPRVDGSIAGA